MAARSSSSKKSADERRLAQLRELANDGANRNCFECHQRGPTYVDMTIGSFVCTKCCGLLRGLNPPHRTKSITMTSFSDDELVFIRNRGNEFNRYVYLGTYDERSNLEKESFREEHKIREFMVQKYDRKRWYVYPEIAQHKMQLDRRQRVAAEQGVSLTGGSVSMPSKPPASFATRSQPVTPAGGELWSPPAQAPAPPGTACVTSAAFAAAFAQPSQPSAAAAQLQQQQQQQQQPTTITTITSPPPPTTTTSANCSFGDDLFAMCKEAIPPPADPFRTTSTITTSRGHPQHHQGQQQHRTMAIRSHTSASATLPPVAVAPTDPFGSAPSLSSFCSSAASVVVPPPPPPPPPLPSQAPAAGVSSSSSSSAGVAMTLTADPFAVAGAATTTPGASAMFSPPPPTTKSAPSKSATMGGGFADFDAAFGTTNGGFPPSSEHTDTATPLLPSPAAASSNATTNATRSQSTAASGSAAGGSSAAVAPSAAKTEPAAPPADRYAALAELDEIFSVQKHEPSVKSNESVGGILPSTDPWGNQQAAPVMASANPFSPTAACAPQPATSNNPWGSPAAPGSGTASASSPNPFSMASNSWSGPAAVVPPASAVPPAGLSRLTPSLGSSSSQSSAALTDSLTTGLANVQILKNNDRLTPTTTVPWLNNCGNNNNNNNNSSSSSSNNSSSSSSSGSSSNNNNSNSNNPPTMGAGFPSAWGTAALNSSPASNGGTQQMMAYPGQTSQQQPFGVTGTKWNGSGDSAASPAAAQNASSRQAGGADWATFGQLAWPPSGSETAASASDGSAATSARLAHGWPSSNSTGIGCALGTMAAPATAAAAAAAAAAPPALNAGNGSLEAWPQMMTTSASTPAFVARSHSPVVQQSAAQEIMNKLSGVPQSMSVHSAFGGTQWPSNGFTNGTHQTHVNGRASSNANPFSSNGTAGSMLASARACSTSNPFL